jgi:hypothetical protein
MSNTASLLNANLLDQRAITTAIGEYIGVGDESTAESIAIYNAVMEGESAYKNYIDDNDLTVCAIAEDMPFKDLKCYVEGTVEQVKRDLGNYAQNIKDGIAMLTVDGSDLVNSDVNGWDINAIATIGYNIQKTLIIDGKPAQFCSIECAWVLNEDESVSFPYSEENGLPDGISFEFA